MILSGAIVLGTMVLAAAGPSDATKGREQFIAMLTARAPGEQVTSMAAGAPGPLTPRQFALISQERRLIRQQQILFNRATQLASFTSPNPARAAQFDRFEARTLAQLQRNLQAVERQILVLSRVRSNNPRVQATIASLQAQAALIAFQTRQLQNRGANPPGPPGDRPPATPSR